MSTGRCFNIAVYPEETRVSLPPVQSLACSVDEEWFRRQSLRLLVRTILSSVYMHIRNDLDLKVNFNNGLASLCYIMVIERTLRPTQITCTQGQSLKLSKKIFIYKNKTNGIASYKFTEKNVFFREPRQVRMVWCFTDTHYDRYTV
jgi:hypothetical protein